MDKENLQRANELAETIKEIEDFLKAFPENSKQFKDCQIKVLYNFSPKQERSATIIADLIPRAFFNLKVNIGAELERYEKEFEEL